MSVSNLENEPVNAPGNQMPPPQPGPQDVVRLLLQRLLKDKILLGLIIVGVLTIFVGVAFTNDDPKANKATPIEPLPQATAPIPAGAGAAGVAPTQPAGLTPELATKFVTWWLQKAMDYSLATG